MIVNRGRYEFRCTPELHEAIRWAAYRRHQSVNAYMCSVMELAVKADIEAENERQAAAPADGVDHGGAGAVG